MSQTIFGVFADATAAEKAVGALIDRGAKADDISVVSKDPAYLAAGEAVVYDRTNWSADVAVMVESGVESEENASHAESAGKRGFSTTTPADAETGAVKEAEIGIGLGVLASMAALFVPGFGIVIGGGALATALGATIGAGAAGAIAGGVTGYLVDQGVPDVAAEYYHQDYSTGSTILTVDIPSGALNGSEVEAILLKYHAERVNTFETRADESRLSPSL